MARAAVRAKQAQRAQAQATVKPSRKQRKHASGGNPNQDLFFMRLRRRQKWVFLGLAIVFAVSFTALGVGSGNGNDLEQSISSFFTNWLGGGDAVSQAKGEIKSNPAKGYKDLADAYVKKNDIPSAIGALTNYLQIKKKDSATWAQLAGYEKSQADTYATEYQNVLASSTLQAPGSGFAPGGSLATQLGTNPIDEFYSTQSSQLSTPLYKKAVAGYSAALTDMQNAAKYASPADLPSYLQGVATAAQTAGQTKVALNAWKRYLELVPNSPNVTQIEGLCKQLGGSCAPQPKHKKK
jgi:hypothetical protein